MLNVLPVKILARVVPIIVPLTALVVLMDTISLKMIAMKFVPMPTMLIIPPEFARAAKLAASNVMLLAVLSVSVITS